MMTIKKLEDICRIARSIGLTDDSPVKVYNPDAVAMCEVILPLDFSQMRIVQQYRIDGTDFRDKYLLLSAYDLQSISSK